MTTELNNSLTRDRSRGTTGRIPSARKCPRSPGWPAEEWNASGSASPVGVKRAAGPQPVHRIQLWDFVNLEADL